MPKLDRADAAFAGLLALGAALVFIETRGLSFFGDEWDFVIDRRGLDPSVLLRPHGPHLSLIPILVYKLLLGVFGASSYLPFRVLAAFDLAIVAGVLGWVCRKRWGNWWGLAPVLLLVTLGTGAPTLLWPFQVGYSMAVVAGVVALVAIERGGGRCNAVACFALVVSLASASQGIGFLAGAAVIVALRPRWRQRVGIIAAPAVLYLLWYLKYGHQASETKLSLFHASVPYLAKALSATFSGVFGLAALASPSGAPTPLEIAYGIPIAAGALAVLVASLTRGWRPPRLFWGTATTLLIVWIAASLSNTPTYPRPPNDRRYLSTDAVLLFVCLCAAIPRLRVARRSAIGVVAVLMIVSAINALQFAGMRDFMAASDVASRAQLGALLILRGTVPETFVPAAPGPPGIINDVTAGPFFNAVDAFGVDADTIPVLEHQDEGVRGLADAVLAHGALTGLATTTNQPPLGKAPPAVISGSARAAGGCVAIGKGVLILRLTPGGYLLKAGAQTPIGATLARFASAYHTKLGVVPPSTAATMAIASDRAPEVPWRMRVSGAGGRVCALAAS